jgi:hypothetical protein
MRPRPQSRECTTFALPRRLVEVSAAASFQHLRHPAITRCAPAPGTAPAQALHSLHATRHRAAVLTLRIAAQRCCFGAPFRWEMPPRPCVSTSSRVCSWNNADCLSDLWSKRRWIGIGWPNWRLWGTDGFCFFFFPLFGSAFGVHGVPGNGVINGVLSVHTSQIRLHRSIFVSSVPKGFGRIRPELFQAVYMKMMFGT